MLDIEHLKTFVAIAELRSFSKAAKHLCLTQSAISQRVKRLEDELNNDLISRTTREIVLTEPGEKLLVFARQILALEQEVRETLKNDLQGKVIHIGAPENFVSKDLLSSLSVFYQKYPKTRFEITVDLSQKLHTLYDQGKLDIVVVRQKAGSGGIFIRRKPLVWIDSRDHPSVQCRPLPLVVFPPDGLYRDDIFHLLDRMKRSWHIALTSPVLSGILSAVSHGIGISMVPRSALRETHRVLDEKDGFYETPDMELALYYPPWLDQSTRFLVEALLDFGSSDG